MLRAAAIAAAIASLALAAPAHAAAPNYILIHGPGLEQPILLHVVENGTVLLTLVQAPYASPQRIRQLRNRPRLGLALFWDWRDRPGPRALPQRTSEAPSAQRTAPNRRSSRFGSTAPTSPDSPRPRFLRILARYGVPIRN